VQSLNKEQAAAVSIEMIKLTKGNRNSYWWLYRQTCKIWILIQL